MTNNPFEDEDIVLEALAELVQESFERSSIMIRRPSAFAKDEAEGETEPDREISLCEIESIGFLRRGLVTVSGTNGVVEGHNTSIASNRGCNCNAGDSFKSQVLDGTVPLSCNRQDAIEFFGGFDRTKSHTPGLQPHGSWGERSTHSCRSGIAVEKLIETAMSMEYSDLEMLYQCPICLELPRGKVLETDCCTQFFCDSCLDEVLNSSMASVCPLCRSNATFHQNVSVELILSTVTLKCRTCNENVAIRDFDEHQAKCKCREASLSGPSNIGSLPHPTQPEDQVLASVPIYHTKQNPNCEILCRFLPSQEWACERCTLLNSACSEICEACCFPSPNPLSADDVNDNEGIFGKVRRERQNETAMNHRRTLDPQSLQSNEKVTLADDTSPNNFSSGLRLSDLQNHVPQSFVVDERDQANLSILPVHVDFLSNHAQCPVCKVTLQVPKVFGSSSDLFRCGNCRSKLKSANRAPSDSISSVSMPISRVSTNPSSSASISGSLLLKISSGNLVRKVRWKSVTWTVADHTLYFISSNSSPVRMVHIHPFVGFGQVRQQRSASKPNLCFHCVCLLENPRESVAKLLFNVKLGAFSNNLPVKELCEVAAEGDAKEVLKFIRAVETAVRTKRGEIAVTKSSRH